MLRASVAVCTICNTWSLWEMQKLLASPGTLPIVAVNPLLIGLGPAVLSVLQHQTKLIPLGQGTDGFCTYFMIKVIYDFNK